MSNSRDAVARLLGADVSDATPLAGGLSTVTTADGRQIVAKRGAGPNANAAEAAGLRWLSASGDIAVPEVLAFDEDWLLISYIPRSAPTLDAAVHFGRSLAALHLRGAPGHGAAPPDGPVDAWIGLAPMRNVVESRWTDFYVRHRVEPYLRTAFDQGVLSDSEISTVEAACARIDDVNGPDEPPARLHGDLWSGNLQSAADGIWLIDPAAHGGHRETDLAMLQLFGAPHQSAILDAYADAASDLGAPLPDGWRQRVPLHQLFPLLVHTVLFGGGYGAQAVSAARAVLAL